MSERKPARFEVGQRWSILRDVSKGCYVVAEVDSEGKAAVDWVSVEGEAIRQQTKWGIGDYYLKYLGGPPPSPVSVGMPWPPNAGDQWRHKSCGCVLTAVGKMRDEWPDYAECKPQTCARASYTTHHGIGQNDHEPARLPQPSQGAPSPHTCKHGEVGVCEACHREMNVGVEPKVYLPPLKAMRPEMQTADGRPQSALETIRTRREWEPEPWVESCDPLFWIPDAGE